MKIDWSNLSNLFFNRTPSRLEAHIQKPDFLIVTRVSTRDFTVGVQLLLLLLDQTYRFVDTRLKIAMYTDLSYDLR